MKERSNIEILIPRIRGLSDDQLLPATWTEIKDRELMILISDSALWHDTTYKYC
jgi:hypothetical protein